MASQASKGAKMAVVGVGAQTAVGMTAPASAAAVRAGVTGFGEHPFMIDTAGNKMIVARAPYLGEESGPDRLLALAEPAARDALAPVTSIQEQLTPIRMTLGLPPARPGQPAMGKVLAERLAGALHDTGRVGRIEVIETGHAAGLMALESAWRALREGREDFHLIGGVDSYLEPETLEWLEGCDQLHGAGPQNNAWGFIPGEAAGFCLMASEAARARYNLPCRCRVLSVASAREKNLIKTDTVCIGIGLTEAVRQALVALPDGVKVDRMICDQNGEPYRADEFGFTLVRTSEHFVSGSDFLAPADCWGDVGAASGPLFVTLAAAAAERGYARGPHYLIWASSEGGERVATLLQLDVKPREV
jgi:3-oxoacyl-[acyl-carrier-protein] synthase-1